MMNTEKRKGLPGSRSIAYLLTGLLIGAGGVLGLMFALTLPACACEPQPPTLNVPMIPTPVAGVTGTAAAQMVSTAPHLLAFAVDEAQREITLSYHDGSQNRVIVRAWTGEPLSAESRVLPSDTENNFPDLTALKEAAFSPNKMWHAFVDDQNRTYIKPTTGEAAKEVPVTGFTSDMAFSADNALLGVISMDKAHYQRHYVEVFLVSDLTRLKAMTLEAANVYGLTFSPNNRDFALVVDDSVRVMPVDDDEQRYFEGVVSVQQMAFDPLGRWLAVLDTTVSGSGITFYDLARGETLPPQLVATATLTEAKTIIGFQFLGTDRLLVGTQDATLTLYVWTGTAWGEAQIVMTEADLE